MNSILRNKNRETVKYYVRLTGDGDGEARLSLFDEEARFELPFTHNLNYWSTVFEGKERLKRLETVLRPKLFSKWKFSNVKVYQTQFDSIFLVFCDGDGLYCGAEEDGVRPYHNQFVLYFKMRDGKIKELRQFQNPSNIARMLGFSCQD